MQQLQHLHQNLHGVYSGVACLPEVEFLTATRHADSSSDILPDSLMFMTQHPPSLHAVDTSTSTPSSDTDWVSPFTLPPLPAFARRRTALSSPQRQHQRLNSSAYYAAAWGSPYATPSPAHSPPSNKRSLSFQEFSPSGLRRPLDNVTNAVQRSPGSEKFSARERRKRAQFIHVADSDERPNWLSDSDDGSVTSKSTPTRDLSNTFRTSHRLQDSTATLTQETYTKSSPRSVDMEDVLGQDKPLPSLPKRASVSSRPGTSGGSPSRPRIGTSEPFYRPKKKVVWKGKTCIIALPLDDTQRFEQQPLLSPTDVKNRLRQWEVKGCDTRGFILDDSSQTTSSQRDGQSRPLFPDPAEMHRERKEHVFNVSIPNQAEWESWVEYLKEEKLRALGVTSSNSEAPASTRSPLSASMSRTSSQYPSMPISPENGPFGFIGTSSRVSSNPFAPPFVKSPGTASSSVLGASPVYDPLTGLRHGYKQSIVLQPMQARMTSPFDYSLSQPSLHGPSSPPGYFNHRQMSISPAGRGGVLSLDEVLSPVSPFAPEHNALPSRSGPVMQQNDQQTQAAHQQRQLMQTQSSRQSLPPTAIADSGARPSLEIAHPTPRSHRHNLSEALQREIDDAERTIEENDRRADLEESTPVVGPTPDEFEEQLLHEEEDEEEPPITQHPDAADNRSDIETNPSLAASPMPVPDRNPFEDWQNRPSLPETKSSTSGIKGHATKPSISKLNVEAKPFDPKGRFSSSTFTFGNASFNPFGASQGADVPSLRGNMFLPAASKTLAPAAAPHLNVAAPAFTPLAAQPKPSEGSRVSTFNFSSATFNVEAPEFNPTGSLGSLANSHMSKQEDAPSTKIFGDVVIDPTLKPTRRNSKAVSILRPVSKDGPDSELDSEGMLANEEHEDDEGRPQAPLERQKRTKRSDNDGDRSPVFAAGAPFLQGNVPQNDDDPFLIQSIQTSSLLDAPAGSPMPLAEKPESGSGLAAMERSSPYTFRDEADAVKFSGATPLTFPNEDAPAPRLRRSDIEELPVSGHTDSELDSPPTRVSSHKPISSLSALAKPFEFAPRAPSVLPGDHVGGSGSISDQSAKPRKSHGLEVSRWAATPSPPSSPLPQPDDPAQANVDIDDSLVSYIAADESDSHPQYEGEEGAFDNGEPPAEIEDSDRTEQEHASESVDEPVPSYEEIDAVMKQFEDNPDLGVERLDTPPVRSTPLTDLHLQPNLRSDAPSPSPRRVDPQKNESHGEEYMWRPPKQILETDISVHKLTSGNEPVSDWNDAMSPVQINRLETRSQFFDSHVSDLVDGILENRLVPLENTLKTIQHSIALLATGPRTSSSGRRSMSTDVKSKDSDADDEDDYNAFEGWEAYRSRSPTAKKSRKPDRIRAAIMDALAAHHAPIQEQTRTELDSVHVALAELKEMAEQSRKTPSNNPEALKMVIEEVISTHPRLRGHRVQQSHGEDDSKRMLQVNGLETMLKLAEERTENEAESRRQAEDEVADTLRRLRHAEEDVAQYKESSQEAERSLSAFIKEREAYQDLDEDVQNLKWKNAALETTLEEYRVSSDKWRDDIQEEHTANKVLRRALEEVKEQLDERSRSRQALRNKVEQLQQSMFDVARDVAADQAEWRKQEHALISKHVATQTALEHEIRHREKIEMELDELDKEHKDNIRYRAACGAAEQEVARLQALVSTLQDENKTHKDKSFQLERELSNAKENAQTVLSKSAIAGQAELEQARSDASNRRADFEAQIARLKSRVDNAELDLEEQKTKHETALAEAVDSHSLAMQDAADKREAALQEQHATHERKLADLRDRHTRALHNSSDDRHRLEHHLNEKLALSDDKVQHLEGKVTDLEERLEITKSAARAAVEAATAKDINLPTPAPSTVASPPHAPAVVRSASITFVPGSDIPEKISPQALRESVMVLQDQLQNREQTIETLQSELAAIDKDAPAKIKDRETEISWLRELLSVRIDDIEDIVNTLNKPDFDREAAKDAAIRLKANLQMEQQLKERAATGMTIQLPSIVSLQSLTQSPRALPMAAVAALGNWRKARDSSFGALSDLASNLGPTPTRSTSGSPASFLSGMMTPPSTTVKTPIPPNPIMSPPSMRPLANVAPKSSTEARPLRAYNAQPRALSSRQQDKRPTSQLQTQSLVPSTPPLMVQNSYDGDADVQSLTGDLDPDASPLDGKENKPFATAI